MEIVKKYDFSEDDVERIDVGMTSGGSFKMFFPEPKDIYEAKFSIHFCVALVLHFKDWGLRYHTQEVVDDPAMRKLYPLVNHYLDEELDKQVDKDHADYHAIVTVTLKNGTQYRVHAHPPVFDYEQIKEKFYDSTCNCNVITRERSDKIVNMVKDLEHYDIKDLASLIY